MSGSARKALNIRTLSAYSPLLRNGPTCFSGQQQQQQSFTSAAYSHRTTKACRVIDRHLMASSSVRTLDNPFIAPFSSSSSTSSADREPDPGGKPIPTDGSYRTVYDDFNNILASPDDDVQLAVRSMGDANFTLTDGLVCYTPIILLQRNVLLWDAPPLGEVDPGTGTQAVVMPSGIGWEAWTDDVWSVFEVASPRPEIVIFGTGKTVLPPPAKIRNYLNSLGIQIEAHSTRNACSTYNMLVEEGRIVAAALLPNVRKPTKRILSTESPTSTA